MRELKGNIVGVRFVDIFFVKNKVDVPSEYIIGFVNPFGVESGVETLKVTPSCLSSAWLTLLPKIKLTMLSSPIFFLRTMIMDV